MSYNLHQKCINARNSYQFWFDYLNYLLTWTKTSLICRIFYSMIIKNLTTHLHPAQNQTLGLHFGPRSNGAGVRGALNHIMGSYRLREIFTPARIVEFSNGEKASLKSKVYTVESVAMCKVS
jgi:hypothetical protein